MIYFAKRPDGCIKIGTTIRLSVRLKELFEENSVLVELLGVCSGSLSEEQALHLRFKDYRVDGEWFRPHETLLAFISEEATAWDGVDEVSTWAVRLMFDADDHERIARVAKRMGLNKAPFCRMAIFDRIRSEEANMKKSLPAIPRDPPG